MKQTTLPSGYLFLRSESFEEGETRMGVALILQSGTRPITCESPSFSTYMRSSTKGLKCDEHHSQEDKRSDLTTSPYCGLQSDYSYDWQTREKFVRCNPEFDSHVTNQSPVHLSPRMPMKKSLTISIIVRKCKTRVCVGCSSAVDSGFLAKFGR
jgi:hypothetical protein